MSSAEADITPDPSIPRRSSAAFAVVALAAVQAGGSAPTPLYRYYQESWLFTPMAISLIFAAYPMSILAALLTVGPLSDFLGRRPVALSSLVVSAIAMLAFTCAGSVPSLIASRAIQGFATGAAASTLGAMILDVHLSRGALINSITAFSGTTIGAIGSSALVAFAPAPSQLVFLVMLGVFVVLAGITMLLPETRQARTGAWASLRPHAAVPKQAKRAFWRVSPVNAAGWALGGFYLSLMPSLLNAAAGLTSPFTGGAVVAALTLSGSTAIFAYRDLAPTTTLRTGAIALVLGVSVTLAGVALRSTPLLVLGTLVAGIGFGGSFFGAARTVLPLAHGDERAGLLSAFYIESYLAFSVPAILAGTVIRSIGLTTTVYGYGILVVLAALTAFIPKPHKAMDTLTTS